MGSPSLCLPRDAAPTAPRLILPGRSYELKGWHSGHGRHDSDFFLGCARIQGSEPKTMILILFSLTCLWAHRFKVDDVAPRTMHPHTNALFGTLFFFVAPVIPRL